MLVTQDGLLPASALLVTMYHHLAIPACFLVRGKGVLEYNAVGKYFLAQLKSST